MKKDQDFLKQLTTGTLTEPMDFGSNEYNDFKLLIRSKVGEMTKDQRIKISLLGLKYQMEDYVNSSSKGTEIGEFVKQFINVVEIKQAQFAKYLDIRPSNLSKLINGERRINIELALILENLSNIKAELWLRIQNYNEIKRIQKSQLKEIKKYKLKELIS